MPTETFASSGKTRLLPRQTQRVLVGALALCALVAIVVEVVMPISAGLPIGWRPYSNSQYHLQVGTPPFWNVVADNSLNQDAMRSCTLAVVASPLSEPALRTTLDAMKAPRWMGVSVCGSGVGADTQASLWRPTGQIVVVAGQREPVRIETVGAPQVSERVAVERDGDTYIFMLQEPTAAQAQQDMPDFLTFVRSFRYAS
ncbi:MAG TPA: hypothetical protein VFN78_11270 [Ktedonobacterales bacterium]|nr:hypothetical protein [Ktedonobacterales bacterium]